MLTLVQKQTIDSFIQKLKSGIYTEVVNPCLCGAHTDSQIASKDRYGIDQKIVLCEECGLMRADPYYDEKTLGSFYENEYRKIYRNPNHESVSDFFKEQTGFGKYIFDFLKHNYFKGEIKGKKVFEIGCGAGGILQTFKDSGNEVFGCDFDEEYLNFGKSKGLTLERDDAETLSKHGQADIVILNHTLEHIKNPTATLATVKKILKDDGVLYIALPGIYYIHDTYHGKLNSYLQNAHVWYFTLKTLNSLLARSGFKLVHGNEVIMAIYQKGVSENLQKESSEKIKKYLRKNQILRPYLALKNVSPSHQLRQFTLGALRKNQSVYNKAKGLYHKLKK